MPAPPSIDNYTVPGGVKLFFVAGQGERDLGNITDLDIEGGTEELEHFSNRSGKRRKDKVIVLEEKLNFKFKFDEPVIENLTITVQNLIDWGRAHVKLAPIVSVGGVTNEPALSIANDTMQMIISHPYKWKWNRASATSFLTVANTDEYTITNTSDEFAFIDRAYIEDENPGSTPKPVYPLEVVWEIQATDVKQTPMSKICLDRWSGNNVIVRFDTVPDSTIYRVYVDYQKKPPSLTALSGAGGTFSPIPDDMGSAIRQAFQIISASLTASFGSFVTLTQEPLFFPSSFA